MLPLARIWLRHYGVLYWLECDTKKPSPRCRRKGHSVAPTGVSSDPTLDDYDNFRKPFF
jgi:hypothetical protein